MLKAQKAKKKASKVAQMRDIREKNAKQESAAVDKSELIVSDKTIPDILPPLTEDQKQKKAAEDDKRFRELEKNTRTGFVEMGMILREMKAYGLHAYIKNKQGKTFGSFDSWLKEAAPLSRAGGYAALRAAEKLLPVIPKAELEAMPRYSVELLAKIPAGKLKLDSPIIKAAKTQKKKDLVKTIQQHAPEAHIEQERKINVAASAGSVIDRALVAAMALGELANEAEALEYLANFFLSGPCELQQFSGMDNAQAYNAWKQAKEADAASQDVAGAGEDNEAEATGEDSGEAA